MLKAVAFQIGQSLVQHLNIYKSIIDKMKSFSKKTNYFVVFCECNSANMKRKEKYSFHYPSLLKREKIDNNIVCVTIHMMLYKSSSRMEKVTIIINEQ